MSTIERCNRNKEYNLSNHYQGDAKRVLTVCSASLLRSPTMAVILNKEYGYNCRAVGVDLEYALTPISQAHIIWADEIVCAEQSHKNRVIDFIKELWGDNDIDYTIKAKNIISLNIKDAYGYMDENLVKLIVSKYEDSKTMSELQSKLTEDLNIRD
jgi:predicted protein tyrosine phosphatase